MWRLLRRHRLAAVFVSLTLFTTAAAGLRRLMTALFASVAAPRSSRVMALASLSFALLGTLVGIFTIVIGIGPRSAFDIALHVFFVASLLAGLALVARGRVW